MVTLHFKPNLKWSNGDPITAADWIAGIVLDFTPDNLNPVPYNQIKSITSSGNDLVITFKGIFSPALYETVPYEEATPVEFMEKAYGATLPDKLFSSYDSSLADSLMSANPNYFGTPYKGSPFQKFVTAWLNDPYTKPGNPTTGPYMVSEWTPDQRYVLVPNPYYTALPAAAGHPRPAKIQFVVVSENSPTLVQDTTADSTYNSVDKIEDFSVLDLPTLKQSKYNVLVPGLFEYEHLEFNMGRAPFNDVRVRQALYYALDKQKYLQALFPAADWTKLSLISPFPSLSPFSINSQFNQNPVNLGKARSLLQAAGFATSLGGSGKHVFVNFFTTTSSFRIRSAQIIQRMWAEVGVSMKIHFVKATGANSLFGSYQDGGVLYHHYFDVAEFAFVETPNPDPSELNWDPTQIGSDTNPSGVNYDQIKDPKLVSYFTQARATLDDTQQHALYAAAQKYFVAEAYNISLFNRPNVLVVKGTIGNFKANVTQQGSEWNTWEWWYDSTNSQEAAGLVVAHRRAGV